MADQTAQEEVLLGVRVAEASNLYKFYLNQEKKILGTSAVVAFLTVWELIGSTFQLINSQTVRKTTTALVPNIFFYWLR